MNRLGAIYYLIEEQRMSLSTKLGKLWGPYYAEIVNLRDLERAARILYTVHQLMNKIVISSPRKQPE
jgi:hypothetical protein